MIQEISKMPDVKKSRYKELINQLDKLNHKASYGDISNEEINRKLSDLLTKYARFKDDRVVLFYTHRIRQATDRNKQFSRIVQHSSKIEHENFLITKELFSLE